MNELSQLISQITYILAFILTLEVSYVIGLNYYQLNKQYKIKDIKKVILPPEVLVDNDKVELQQIDSIKIKQALLHFTSVLETNFSKEDLALFYNNINTLKMKPTSLLDVLSSIIHSSGGYYSLEKNKIVLNIGQFEESKNHELFHMASSYCRGNILYSGFRIYNKEDGKAYSVGGGLNEGYTQALAERYFNETHKENPYAYQTKIALLLEKVIGKQKMQSFYMKANLYGLIQELKKYATEEEIMRFITDLDFLTLRMNLNFLFIPTERVKMSICMTRINDFLIKIGTNKLNTINIPDNLKQQVIAEYKLLLPQKAKIGYKKYKVIAERKLRTNDRKIA